MSCGIDPERISLLVDGELSAGDAADVETHLRSCEDCHALHVRLVSLARLYTSAHRPAPVRTDFATEVMVKLATVRSGRAHRTNRRRLLFLGSIAAAAAAAVLVLALLPAAPTASADGPLFRFSSDGWMWAGTSAPIQERCTYAALPAPARIDLGDARVWLDEGTFLTVERLDPPEITLIGGAIVVHGDRRELTIRTPAGQIDAPPEARVAVRCELPEDPAAFAARLRTGENGLTTAAGFFVGQARAGQTHASEAPANDRPVTVDCLARTVRMPGGESLAEGNREVTLPGAGPARRAPYDPESVWWKDLREQEPGTVEGLGAPGRPALDALRSARREGVEWVARALHSLARALTENEYAGIERQLLSQDTDARSRTSTIAIARGEISDATRNGLRERILSGRDSGLDLAVSVGILAALDPVGSEAALVRAARGDCPPDVRLVATWALVSTGSRAGVKSLERLLHDEDRTVREATVRCAGTLRTFLPLELARRLLDSGEPALRKLALRRMLVEVDRESYAKILDILGDEDQAIDLRLIAARIVGSMHSGPQNRRRIVELLGSLPESVGQMLASSLLGTTRAPEIRTALIEHRNLYPRAADDILIGLAPVDDRARDLLVARLPDLSAGKAALAIRVLLDRDQENGRAYVREQLAAAVEGSPFWIVLVQELSSFDGEAAVRLARGLAADESQSRSSTGLALLATLPPSSLDEESVRLIVAGLAGADMELRRSLCVSLESAGRDPVATPALIAVLTTDTSAEVRVAAARSLASRPGTEAADALVEVALEPDSPKKVVRVCLESLVRREEFQARGLELLGHGDPEIRLWAGLARAVTSPGRTVELEGACGSASNAAIARFVALAESAIRRNDAARRLLLDRCLGSPSPRLRMAAARLTSARDPEEGRQVRKQLERDTRWQVRVASACSAGATRRELAAAVATMSIDVPRATRLALGAVLPIAWEPGPTIPGWVEDDAALTPGRLEDVHGVIREQLDEMQEFARTAEPAPGHRSWRWLTPAAIHAGTVVVKTPLDGADRAKEFYERLSDSLRSRRNLE